MPKSKQISAMLEDYLEAILQLDEERGAARVRDIAQNLGVHKSTVSAALKALAGKGLVRYSPYELAKLTPEGLRIARRVARSHVSIKRFLTDVLLVDDEVAGKTACRMEHAIGPDVLERLGLLMRFAQRVGAGGGSWRDGFEAFIRRSSHAGGGRARAAEKDTGTEP